MVLVNVHSCIIKINRYILTAQTGGMYMSILDNFSTWKEFLASRIDEAKEQGIDNKTLTNVAQHVGDYLNRHVEPENVEERVLKDLWDAASETEQQALASTMIKLVQKD